MEVTKEFVKYIEDKINRKVIAIYLSGSELNHLNVKETCDKDLIVVAEDLPEEILSGTIYSKQTTFNYNEVEYDIKIYSLRQIYKMIIKGGFNTLELFARDSIYNASDRFEKLFNKENANALSCFNIRGLIKSINGMTKSTIFKIEENKLNHKTKIKFMVQAFKVQCYLKQLHSYYLDNKVKFPIELNVSDYEVVDGISLLNLKKSAYDNHLSEDEENKCFDALKELFKDNEEYSKELEDNSDSIKNKFAKEHKKIKNCILTLVKKEINIEI